jgi:NAD(P)-dependent dehydrogenase (short-subunit alcohol dehydrogenase family)
MMKTKTVLITGGNKGIGLSLTEAFNLNKFNVFVGSRSLGDLQKIDNKNVTHIKTDIRDESQISNLVNLAQEKTGKIDVVINNAGYSEWRPIEEMDNNFLDDILSTNLKSVFFICKHALKSLNKGSSIINISSIAGKRGSANNSAYSATKFGVNAITQSLAKELGPKGIRVNGICPVLIETEGLLNALEKKFAPGVDDGRDFIKNFCKENSALGHMPSAKDVASLCLFLASDEASSITGQNINLDCGVFPQ